VSTHSDDQGGTGVVESSEPRAMVEFTVVEMEALRREATGQSIRYHVELNDEQEEFWGRLSHKLEHAIGEARKYASVGASQQPGGTSDA